MSKFERVSILIVTHNHRDFVDALLDSCANLPEVNKYICDAASTDGTNTIIEKFTRDRPDFFYFEKNVLEGFSKNNNDLIRHYNLQGNKFVLINPDCFFEREAFVRFLELCLSDERIGVAAPVLFYPSGQVQFSWRKFPSPVNFILNRLFGSKQPRKSNCADEHTADLLDIEWALGAFLYVSDLFILKKDGLIFDERYRLYCEDADLCFEAHCSGFRVVGVNSVGIFHTLQEKSRSVFSKYNFWNLQSGMRFFRKWGFRYFKILSKIRAT